ncbi:SEC-C domain-containing protein [bacterium]|nr:SEC-C domain-containing protein [bacterium]
MKNFCLVCSVTILFCLIAAFVFLGIGRLISLIFPVSVFQAAMLLMAPFCILLILLPLLLINQKMERMIEMAEEDYMLWDEENFPNSLAKPEKKKAKTKKKQNKIIVMENSPIFDRNAPCPCGSGEKYKNCCGKSGKTSEK